MIAALERLFSRPGAVETIQRLVENDEAATHATVEAERNAAIASHAGVSAEEAKALPALVSALDAAASKTAKALDVLQQRSTEESHARAALWTAQSAFEDRRRALDHRIRELCDPSIPALVEELRSRHEDICQRRLTPGEGFAAGQVAVRLNELARHVAEEVTLLPTPEALKAADNVRAEVGKLLGRETDWLEAHS